MAKIVVNTNYDSAGTRVCVDDLIPRLKEVGHEVARNDWKNYQEYDMVLFMSPDADVVGAKKQNPKIKCGIMDPKIDYRHLRERARRADFCVVSSLEQRDVLYEFNEQVVIYYMFPETREVIKEHVDKPPVRIGYHGNKEHLDCLSPDVVAAIDRLSAEVKIEFWAMYNIKKLGRWRGEIGEKVKVRHIQWSEQAYYDDLAKVDVGIVNNEIPYSAMAHDFLSDSRWYRYGLSRYPYRKSDTVVRFKYSSNPGRIYVFSQLGIPVVADYAPSANQFIEDGETGLIARGRSGWYQALSQVVNSADLRQALSDNLRNRIDSKYSIDQNFEKLNSFLLKILASE